VEGIRGNEQMPPPEHNATLPFTRYIAGAGDYTICYLTSRKQTTFAHQLAMNVISFSPLQWVCWYDTPGELGDEPEFDFFARVPTVWDETKVIHGRIGEYATIARRSGEDWFVGTINNSQARNLRLPLRFLSPGKNYIASIYSDKDNGTTRNRIGIEKRLVTDGTVLDIPLSSAGGQAIWIRSLVLDR
jgi:alpha-glucosidase